MRSYPRIRRRLCVQPLEPRDVPAGVIQASLVNGTLTLTGDDLANIVSVQINTGAAPTVVLTPDTGATATLIDDVNDPAVSLPGDPVTIPGTVTTLKVDLKGGDDSLSIDGSSDFVLSGGATIQLGDGNNTLGLSTSGKIDLASLAVKAGDGADSLTVAGGAGLGSTVAGTATFDLGSGDVTANLAEVAFAGPAGVRLTAGPGTVNGAVTATDVTVAKTFRAAVGTGHLDLSFNFGHLGGLTETGNTVTATLADTSVDGGVSVRGAQSATLTILGTGTVAVGGDVAVGGGRFADVESLANGFTARDVAVTGSVQSQFGAAPGSVAVRDVFMTGSFSAQFNTLGGAVTARRIRITGGSQAEMGTGSPAFTAADVSVTAQFTQFSEFGGTFAVHNLAVLGTLGGNLDIDGTAVTVGGDLRLTGSQFLAANVAASVLAEVKGSLTAAGGLQGATFATNGNLKVDRDVTVTTGDGPDQVTIGDGSAAASVLGRLTVTTGAGNDAVSLNGLEVGKAARVSTGAGADALAIDLGTKFDGTFFADLGTGDDSLAVAQNTTAAAPVTFAGGVSVLGGAGNDRLLLGLDPGSGGNDNTLAAFNGGAVNRIDGGTGFNSFDGLTPDQAPAQYTGLDAADFLHWTDPNP